MQVTNIYTGYKGTKWVRKLKKQRICTELVENKSGRTKKSKTVCSSIVCINVSHFNVSPHPLSPKHAHRWGLKKESA